MEGRALPAAPKSDAGGSRPHGFCRSVNGKKRMEVNYAAATL
jgi:hypothetical protein